MAKLVSVAEMRAIEKEGDSHGVSYAEMMERAGTGLGVIVDTAYSRVPQKTALALVGSGNNGGDSLVALVELARRGWRICAYLLRPRPAGDELIEQVRAAAGLIGSVEDDPNYAQLDGWLGEAGVLLDGVLGTGIKLPLREGLAQSLAHVKNSAGLPPVVAVDCPSGVDCDSGETSPVTLPADLTICMDAVKAGLLKFPAFQAAGRITTVDLGLPEDLPARKAVHANVITTALVRSGLPVRTEELHKGTFGTTLVVAGCKFYSGAALLAGEAAYRCGAGLVRIALTEPLWAALAGRFREATWLPLDDENGFIAASASDAVLDNLDRVTAVLVGPGLGTHPGTVEFIQNLIKGNPRGGLSDQPWWWTRMDCAWSGVWPVGLGFYRRTVS